ncbi:MAG: cytochrome c [Pseudomonadota bacterium]
MKRSLTLAAVSLIAAAGIALAHENHRDTDLADPISLRTAAMKNVGQATGIGARMMKGELAYDPMTARAVLLTLNTSALGFFRMFPEDSQAADSDAAPAVWDDRAGFREASAKFIADTELALAAPIGTIEQFGVQFQAVTQNCGSCHRTYRIKR